MVYDVARMKVREITNPKLRLKEVSRTFHGRDIFAPAAAHLAARRARWRNLANRSYRTIFDRQRANPLQRFAKNQWSGTILKVDRFGNLITNFHISDFPDAKMQPIELRIGVEADSSAGCLTYSSRTDIGEVFAIVGSSGYIEVAANQGSAAKTLGCGAGSPVELEVYFF